MIGNIFSAHKDAVALGRGVAAKLIQALRSDGRATVASQIFGNPPMFKEPGGTEPVPAVGRGGHWPDRMTVAEAGSNGFLKAASSCGWGTYRADDLDGGLGSIWYLEKDADGTEFLVKQVDQAGDVVRRLRGKAERGN